MAGTKLAFKIADAAADGVALLTIPGDLGLFRRRVELEAGAEEGEGFAVTARFADCFVRLGGGGDSFVATLLPGLQDSEGFDLGVKWDSRSGVSFAGGTALQVTIPLRAKLPVVSFDTLHLAIVPAVDPSTSVTVELSADVTASLLGVIEATVHRLGVVANLHFSAPPPDAVRIGPLGATVAFKPPTGAGLSLNLAGVINGGGFLSIDIPKGQYAGIIAVNVIGIGVSAIAIINTKPNFSLLAILAADFRPVGIDVGYGFTINAVGGLFGLHRGADLQALSQAARSGAIASLMFPSDPVANAPRILSDLERMFPAVNNQFLVGPMLQVGWGKPAGMIALSVGLIVQVPDPKLAIVGVLSVMVPPLEVALLQMHVSFVGSVDFANKFLRFDASLFDSRLQLYALEGDMAVRLRWGDRPALAVSVGGFNPRFVPAADLDIQPMQRISTNLLPLLDNPRIRMESYYAVTSNTLQHGARVEIYAAAAGFGIHGYLGYDLLAQISPLHFEASFGGAIAVLAAGEPILSLGLDLVLAGPGPWHVEGGVSFKILFVRFRVGIDETFGSDDAPQVDEFDVAAEFQRQLANPRNWTASLPAQGQLLVLLRRDMAINEGEILAHPSATLEFSERAIPLAVTLQRYGAAKPKGATRFDIAGMTAGGAGLVVAPPGAVKADFAPGQFFDQTNDEKMSSPAFVQLTSGVRADASALVGHGSAARRLFIYESGVSDAAAIDAPGRGRAFALVDATLAAQGLAGGAAANSALYRERVAALPAPNAVRMGAGGYRIVDAATLQPAAVATLATHVEAAETRQALVGANPALAGQLLVVPAYELA